MFDDDPEDGYDAGDPPLARLEVLRALAGAVESEMVDPTHDHRRARTRIAWARFVLENLERDGYPDPELADRLAGLARFYGGP